MCYPHPNMFVHRHHHYRRRLSRYRDVRHRLRHRWYCALVCVRAFTRCWDPHIIIIIVVINIISWFFCCFITFKSDVMALCLAWTLNVRACVKGKFPLLRVVACCELFIFCERNSRREFPRREWIRRLLSVSSTPPPPTHTPRHRSLYFWVHRARWFCCNYITFFWVFFNFFLPSLSVLVLFISHVSARAKIIFNLIQKQ